jgi:N-acetylmuramoyl-L-alanine amidase
VVERPRLAVLAFDPSILIELGFIDSSVDYPSLIDTKIKLEICEAIAATIGKHFTAEGAEGAEKTGEENI